MSVCLETEALKRGDLTWGLSCCDCTFNAGCPTDNVARLQGGLFRQKRHSPIRANGLHNPLAPHHKMARWAR